MAITSSSWQLSEPSPLHPASVWVKSGMAAGPDTSVSSGLDLNALDRSVDPCVDFYQYACGGWMAANPIPADRSRWGRFDELAERNTAVLRDILEKAAAANGKRDAQAQKIGDYYASCMDEQGIEQKGLAPIKTELERIGGIRDANALADEIAHLHQSGVDAAFGFGGRTDARNSSRTIATVDQGGLGLPDRDYYLKADPKSVELRKQYLAHIGKMFQLLGDAPDKAAREAQAVMDLETVLAKASLDLVSRRDPEKTYHKMRRREFTKLAPSFPWARYFKAVGSPAFDELNVAAPEYFRQLDTAFAKTPVENWQAYLAWRLVHESATLLPAAFVNENFDFYGRTLMGAKENRPRWKRCVASTDGALSDALGRKYVERTFGAEGKARTLAMVKALEKALGEDIRDLPWMSGATKKQALAKLNAITNKIGYPDKWRDYREVKIVRGDAIGNAIRVSEAEHRRHMARIGKPVDRVEWHMTPPTVNASYSPTRNTITFPAGILQPPFYNIKADDALNFGGIGAVIGHELTHGFDDEGRKYDREGNVRDWWASGDGREFERRAQCIADEYSGFVATGDVKLNGKLTLGENTADHGGLRIAYMALMESLAGKQAPAIDGFTPAQRLFLGYAQIWCQNQTEQHARLRAATDPHSPGRYRVNGVMPNLPEFQKAFGCSAGQPMVSPAACRVW